ncbi:MAG TPA: hypothetical protein VKB19_00260 [Pedobacter sp.]|nr:hypothetical protein [Pedobacter sp.]
MKGKHVMGNNVNGLSFDPNYDKIVENLKDHSKDAYVVSKGKAMEDLLKRVGFPQKALEIQAKHLKKLGK